MGAAWALLAKPGGTEDPCPGIYNHPSVALKQVFSLMAFSPTTTLALPRRTFRVEPVPFKLSVGQLN